MPYAVYADIVSLINADNVLAAFGVDGVVDMTAVNAALESADAYVDIKLRAAGQPAPNPLTDTTVAKGLKMAAAHVAVWWGWHRRGIQERDIEPGSIGGIMEGYKAFADELLATVTDTLIAEEEIPGSVPGVFTMVARTKKCTPVSDEFSQSI